MSTICMKIDPGMHIGLHLVFFGKTGVTEHHVAALMRHTRYEQQLRRYHNRNLRERSFNVGDLVLH
jgi:hypothetical protein